MTTAEQHVFDFTMRDEIIAAYEKQVKSTKQPTLFTTLEVRGQGIDGVLTITAHDIIEITKRVMEEKFDPSKAPLPSSFYGEGTQETPYKLQTVEEWLWATRNYETTETEEGRYKYFKMGDQIIKVSMHDRFASSEQELQDTDLYVYMQNTLAQYISAFQNPNVMSALKPLFSRFPGMPPNEQLQLIFSTLVPLFHMFDAKYSGIGYNLYLRAEDSTAPVPPRPYLIYKKISNKTHTQSIYIPKSLFLTNTEGEEICLDLTEEQEKDKIAMFIKDNYKEKQPIFLTIDDHMFKYISAKGGSYDLASKAFVRPSYNKLGEKEDLQTTQKQISDAIEFMRKKLPELLAWEIDFKILINMLRDFGKIMPIDELIDLVGENFFPGFLNKTNRESFKNFLNLFMQSVLQNFNPNPSSEDSPVPVRKIFEIVLKNPNVESILKYMLAELQKGVSDTSNFDKFLVLSNIMTVLEMRTILKNKTGEIQRTNTHLPVTVAALFFAETSRSLPQQGIGCPAVFVASLALLDLIESSQSCPEDNQIYSVLNLLKAPKDCTEFVNVFGKVYSESERKKLKDNLVEAYQLKKFGNPSKQGPHIKTLQFDEKIGTVIPGDVPFDIGGYHPMVHHHSFDQVKAPKPSPEFLTMVEEKTASVLLQWLFLRLESPEFKFSLGLECRLGHDFFNPTWLLDTNIREKENLLAPHLAARLESFDCLLPYSNVYTNPTHSAQLANTLAALQGTLAGLATPSPTELQLSNSSATVTGELNFAKKAAPLPLSSGISANDITPSSPQPKATAPSSS